MTYRTSSLNCSSTGTWFTPRVFDNDAEDVEIAQERRFAETCSKSSASSRAISSWTSAAAGAGSLCMQLSIIRECTRTGFTLSKNQAEWANDKIKKAVFARIAAK